MSKFPGFMLQSPTTLVASPFLHLTPWPAVIDDDLLLTIEEAELEEKLKEVRNSREGLFFGRLNVTTEAEETEAEPEDDDADNGEESEGDEFEQETG